MPNLYARSYSTSLRRWDCAGIHNIRVFGGPHVSGAHEIVSDCRKALKDHHIELLLLLENETLGIINGMLVW